MAYELQDYVKPKASKTAPKRQLVSLAQPVYKRLSKMAEDMKLSRAAVVEGLLNFYEDKPQVK